MPGLSQEELHERYLGFLKAAEVKLGKLATQDKPGNEKLQETVNFCAGIAALFAVELVDENNQRIAEQLRKVGINVNL
ncbi:MAG: hypothetical protein Q8R28_19290 [Dehalococcoidia bacterium]|nr:hypothetical protein [Dehalococcoidia bacterium]